MNRGPVDQAKALVRAHVGELRCTAVTCLDTLLIRRLGFDFPATPPDGARTQAQRPPKLLIQGSKL
jgi:hypothetical protein